MILAPGAAGNPRLGRSLALPSRSGNRVGPVLRSSPLTPARSRAVANSARFSHGRRRELAKRCRWRPWEREDGPCRSGVAEEADARLHDAVAEGVGLLGGFATEVVEVGG